MDNFGNKIQLIISLFAVIGGIFGGFAVIIRLLKSYISTPFQQALNELNLTIQDLRDDLNDSRIDRKEHETKLFQIADEHTKQIYNHEGRIQTLEILNKIDNKGE